MKKINNIAQFVAIFFIYMLSDLVYLIPLAVLNVNINKLSSHDQLLLTLSADLFVTVILCLIYKDYLKEKFIDFKKNFNKYLDIGLKYWLIGLGIMYIGNALLALFSPIKEAANETAVQNLIASEPFLAFLLTTFFAPIVEETIFRKSLQDCFTNKKLFIIVSAIVFGYLHVAGSESLFEYLYIIPYGALGGSFAYILSKTDNLYIPIMMHFIHNGLLTLIAIYL